MARQSSTPREIELKLAVSAASWGAYESHPALARAKSETRHEVTTYFDTPELDLVSHGVSLRVRQGPKGRIQTMKMVGTPGVAADRGEWEWQLAQDTPNLAVLEETPVAGILPHKVQLVAVLVTDIKRTVRMLDLGHGAMVELAFDRGTILAGEGRQHIAEMELELKSGDPADLYRLAIELHGEASFRIEPESKAARGYRLKTGAAPGPRKSQDLDLDHDVTVAEGFRQVIQGDLGHLLANQPAALAGDIEGVHQMRVAIRRLRSGLVLFHPLLEPLAARRFEAELQRVGRIFGEARDWDVFCAEILPEAFGEDTADWAELLGAEAKTRRQSAHKGLEAEIMDGGFTPLVLGLAVWVEGQHGEGPFNDEQIGDLRLKDEASWLLDKLDAKVAKRGRDIDGLAADKLHALRKSLKKLRYGIDDMAGLYKPKPVNAYLDSCKALQKRLGNINDAVAGTALAEELSRDRSDLVPAIGMLARHLEAMRSKNAAHLAKAWNEFAEADRFWIP